MPLKVQAAYVFAESNITEMLLQARQCGGPYELLTVAFSTFPRFHSTMCGSEDMYSTPHISILDPASQTRAGPP